MKYAFLDVQFELVKNEYQIKDMTVDERLYKWQNVTIEMLINSISSDITLYVNELDKLYIYLIKYLLDNNFECVTDKLTPNTFRFSATRGKCSNIKIKTINCEIAFINFSKKFGTDFGTSEENWQLLDYAIKKNRTASSVGTDAYNEFIATQLNPSRYDSYVAHQIMRGESHYPVFEYSEELLEAKQNVSGFQMCEQGIYDNLIEYDISSSYPSQLLCNQPVGLPKEYKRLEDVPNTYFKIITFNYINCHVKPNKIEFVSTGRIGQLSLTEKLFELFKENYNCTILLVKITAFKTQKSPFYKFIKSNIIDGKLLEKRAKIAQYNKYIGNSIIGYFGRNTTTFKNTAKIDHCHVKLQQVEESIEPIYLPVYLSVLDKAKSAFIHTIQQYYNSIVYANTDGFLSTIPIDVRILNMSNSLPIGNYREKNKYAHIYIECINGYAGIKDTGEFDNTISGMTLKDVVSPEQYQSRNFTYYLNVPTQRGTIKLKEIKPHQ